MVALQLMINTIILAICAYTLLVVYRAVQQKEDRSHFIAASEIFKDEPRENPWVGFLQEPMSSIRVGAIGGFESFEKNVKKAPMYMVQ